MRALITTFIAIATLVPASSAAASGPNPGALDGGAGVAATGTSVRYVALPTGLSTIVAAVATRDGRVLRFAPVAGSWGIPRITLSGVTGGLSHDGRTLVLAEPPSANQSGPLRSKTQFAILDTKTFTLHQLVRLRGDFSFDALSPDARTLYLIQHVSGQDLTRYRVRAFDLESGRLVRRVISDKRQRGWVMAGYPVGRATTRDGRLVFTLYQRPGGYPFVHALDAVRRTAVCVGLPWPALDNQDPLANDSMRLDAAERALTIQGSNGRRYVLDTRTFRVATPQAQGSSASIFGVGTGAGIAAALAAVVAFVLRRRSRPPRAS